MGIVTKKWGAAPTVKINAAIAETRHALGEVGHLWDKRICVEFTVHAHGASWLGFSSGHGDSKVSKDSSLARGEARGHVVVQTTTTRISRLSLCVGEF